jgi:hypothetical protein
VRIDWSDEADGPDDAHAVPHARSAPDDPEASGKAVSGDDLPDSSPARPNLALRAERTAVYRAAVDAAYRQYDSDHRHARPEKLESETVISWIGRAEIGNRQPDPVDPRDGLKVKDRLAETANLKQVETPRAVGGDLPDDPRNYSNPKTGRLDASWSAYDRAIAAAREHTGGDLGPDSIKMYDYNPQTGQGTGTLIGEQTADRLRGWRIDGQDGHVNWWDWTGGKKGAGGFYGHDWFPEEPSAPGSRYIGWAPWQNNDGNILDGN